MICRPGYNMLDSDPGSMRPIISTPLWQEDDTITIPVHIDRYPAKGWWWRWLRRERDDTITILPLTAIDPGPAFSGAEQSIAAGVNRLNDLSHCRVHYSQFNLMETLRRTFFCVICMISICREGVNWAQTFSKCGIFKVIYLTYAVFQIFTWYLPVMKRLDAKRWVRILEWIPEYFTFIPR